MAVVLGKRGNAAHGHHASALRVGLSAPLDSVAPLGKDTEWDSHAFFEAWTHSEAFRLAHKDAGEHRDLYLGHPQFEGFASVEGSEEMAPAALADG